MYLAKKTYRWKKIYLHQKAQIDNTWILEPCNIIKQEYQNSDKKTLQATLLALTCLKVLFYAIFNLLTTNVPIIEKTD